MALDDLRVLAATVRGVVVYERSKRTSSLPDLLGRFEPAAHHRPLASPDRAARLVSGVLRRLYGERFCLPRSLILSRLLRGAGYPARLHTGVRSTGRGLDGHAWVSIGGIPVGEARDPAERFALTLTHPPVPLPGTPAHEHAHPHGQPPRGARPAG